MREELAKIDPQQKFETGYYHLDRMTQGFKEGDLVILSGITGNGKTEFAVSLAKRYIEQGIHPLFFSYEISAAELLERFGNSDDMPLFYLPRVPQAKTPSWISTKIEESIKKHGTKIVFIDHLHYLMDDSPIRNKNTSEMLAQLCRDFKRIARHLKVVIVLLCHVRKVGGGRPVMEDIKDSSGIIQEADTVMLIHRDGAKRPKAASNSKYKKKQEDDFFDDPLPIFDDTQEVSNKATLYLDKVRRRGGKIGKIQYVFEDGIYKEF